VVLSTMFDASAHVRMRILGFAERKKFMDHLDLYDFSFLGDRRNDAARADRIEKSTNAIDKFFGNLEPQAALGAQYANLSKTARAEILGLDDKSVNETEAFDLDRLRGISSPKLSELSELGDFCKSEISEVRESGITRAGIRSSLAALRSILGRVVERL
jgi:hypothetical protein